MSRQGVLRRTRVPLAALLLHLCVVGLLAAAPALTSRAAVDASSGGFEAPSFRGLAMRALLQVRMHNPPHKVCVARYVDAASSLVSMLVQFEYVIDGV